MLWRNFSFYVVSLPNLAECWKKNNLQSLCQTFSPSFKFQCNLFYRKKYKSFVHRHELNYPEFNSIFSCFTQVFWVEKVQFYLFDTYTHHFTWLSFRTIQEYWEKLTKYWLIKDYSHFHVMVSDKVFTARFDQNSQT